MRAKTKQLWKKAGALMAAVAMTTTTFSGTIGTISAYAENVITSISHTYEFSDNTGKATPVLGGILDGTDTETTGIYYPEDSVGSVTFDKDQLKFRADSVLYLPIQDDTTKVTYSQITNTSSAKDRTTNVGTDDGTYQVYADKKAVTVTVPDITDMIKTVGDQKYIAIYSHGDVKVTKITLTEYNPINRVTVSGTINGAAAAGITAVVFKNLDTDELTTAEVDAAGKYSAVLKRVEGNTPYIAAISKTGYKLDDTDSKNQFTLTGNEATATVDFQVVEAEVSKISGTLTGVPDSMLKGELGLTLVPEDTTLMETPVTLTKTADGTYTFSDVEITPEVTYSYKLTNANDYEILQTVKASEGASTENVVATAKPVYTVSGTFYASDKSEPAVSKVTFTNMNEEGYSYTFDASKDGYTAKLRTGEYVTSAEVEGYTVFDHVSVKDADTTNVVYLEAPEDTTEVPYKAEVTAGKGQDYETIQEAVDAIARMNREEGQRVTIKLTDSLYREQVVINTPNITLTNAEGVTPTVSWYYGIGYAYYSVDPANKWQYTEKYAVDKYTTTFVDKNWGTTFDLEPGATGFRSENVIYESSFNRYMTDEEIADGIGKAVDVNKDDRSNKNVDVQLNKNKERACAMYIQADNVEYNNCQFLSSQDTLYTGSGEESIYFKNCVIEGTTDFICGSGNPVFDSCTLSIYGYSDKVGDGGYITASKEAGSHGYLFYNCKVVNTSYNGIKAGTKNVYFGRPWGAGTKMLAYNTEVESASMIHAAGYASMSNVTPAMAFYSEYNTHTADGAAVDTSKRAAGVTILTDAQAAEVSVETYFDEWRPYFYYGVDYTELDAAVAAAEALTVADYKDFTAVEAALAAAKAAETTATQADVDTLTKNLKDAVAALEKIEPTPVEKKNGFVTEDGKKYWYEDDVKQGTEGRGKEIYDPETDAWYWLDAVQGGAVATGKDVYQESNGGKWVRYDENGHMIKGWQETEAGIYYFDPITGAMTKGEVTIDGAVYRFNEITGTLLNLEFYTDENGNRFWYENGIRQGTEGRGKEIYDPETDAWYWLDAVDNGKVATSKDVYQESWAGQFADREDGTGKWVRYDENGHMVKGWDQQNGNTYYFDMVTGAMAKGNAQIDGVWYTFDLYTGIMQ